MRTFLKLLIFSLLISSCNENTAKTEPNDETAHIKQHQEMDKIDAEYQAFEKVLELLYSESSINPQLAISKADSLLKKNKVETDKYKMPIRKEVESQLNYLKAEIYYKTGEYKKSLEILNREDYNSCDYALAIAANCTQLKDHKKARMFIDSIRCYIEEYALGNYYETVNNKQNALKIYKEIKQHREYGHYRLATNRIKELEKSNPILLSELLYPTGNPAHEITEEDDNEIRSKIFAMLDNIPECKGLERHIFRSPKTNDKDYYWIKVGKNIKVSHDYEPDYKAQYDFFIYAKDLSVKHYNPETKTLLSLEKWRKTRNR